MSRKIRSDSVLDSMPLHQQDALIEWLIEEKIAPELAVDRLWKDFGVKTSRTPVDTFYQRHCAPRLLRRSHVAAMNFAGEADGLGEHWAAPSKALIRQKFFDVMTAPVADPNQLVAFAKMVADLERGELDAKKLAFDQQKHAETNALKREDLALQREKFETSASELAMKHAAEIKTIAADRSLNADAKVAQVRQRLFGSAPGAATEAKP